MTDEDHLCAAATNLLMALWMEDNKPEMQDIPTRINKVIANTDLHEIYGCKYYDGDYEKCLGTKGMEMCTCGGNPSKCDFYDDVRKNAKQG
jgi:hypothetical protein